MTTSRADFSLQAKNTGRLPALVIFYIVTFTLPIQVNIAGLVFTPLRLLLILVTIPLTINLFRGLYSRVLLIDIMFFLHMLWGAIALTVNNPDRVVGFMGSNAIEFIGGYLIARACIQNVDDFRRLCWFLILVVMLTFPLALYETITGDEIIIRTINSIPGVSSTTIANSEPRFGLARVQVFLAHPIHYGLFASLMLSVLFIGFRDILSPMSRYGLTLIVLLCTVLSLSSGALLAAFLQVALIFWAWILRNNRMRWLILALIGILAYIMIDLLSNRTPIQVFMHYATFNAHTAYWRGLIFEWGMMNVWGNPIFGIGLNDWERPIWMRSSSMDNFWLVIAVRYGFPGLILLGFGYVYALYRIGKRNLGGDIAFLQFRQGWMICMSGLTFALATVHIWGELYSFVFFFFGAGIWMLTAAPNANGAISVDKNVNESRRLEWQYNHDIQDKLITTPQVAYTRFSNFKNRS